MNSLIDNKELLGFTRPKHLPEEVQHLIRQIIKSAYVGSFKQHLGIRLAALFDLFVSCQYYNGLANKGWTYCPKAPQLLLYAYTNICPRCLGQHDYVFTKANKPESGQIGMAATEILCEMLISYFASVTASTFLPCYKF